MKDKLIMFFMSCLLLLGLGLFIIGLAVLSTSRDLNVLLSSILVIINGIVLIGFFISYILRGGKQNDSLPNKSH